MKNSWEEYGRESVKGLVKIISNAKEGDPVAAYVAGVATGMSVKNAEVEK